MFNFHAFGQHHALVICTLYRGGGGDTVIKLPLQHIPFMFHLSNQLKIFVHVSIFLFLCFFSLRSFDDYLRNCIPVNSLCAISFRHGFNILLHGLGSKRKLLDEFRKQMLPNLCHIVVNGFFPSLTIKSVSIYCQVAQ